MSKQIKPPAFLLRELYHKSIPTRIDISDFSRAIWFSVFDRVQNDLNPYAGHPR